MAIVVDRLGGRCSCGVDWEVVTTGMDENRDLPRAVTCSACGENVALLGKPTGPGATFDVLLLRGDLGPECGGPPR